MEALAAMSGGRHDGLTLTIQDTVEEVWISDDGKVYVCVMHELAHVERKVRLHVLEKMKARLAKGPYSVYRAQAKPAPGCLTTFAFLRIER